MASNNEHLWGMGCYYEAIYRKLVYPTPQGELFLVLWEFVKIVDGQYLNCLECLKHILLRSCLKNTLIHSIPIISFSKKKPFIKWARWGLQLSPINMHRPPCIGSMQAYSVEPVLDSMSLNWSASGPAKLLLKKSNIRVSMSPSRYRQVSIFVGRCCTSTIWSTACISSPKKLKGVIVFHF